MKLWSTTVGNGPKRAALVHGMSGDSETWFEFAPWIADHGYTVTLVDQRGHGRSDRAASYWTSDFADDLVQTLPKGLDVIMGHSLGGRSLALAVDRLLPRKAVYLDPGWDIPADLVLELPLRDDGSLIDAEQFAELNPTRSRAQIERALESMAMFDPAIIEAPYVPLASMAPADKPVVPSLVVLADPSPYVSPALQERLRSGGYVTRVVDGGQHDLHVDNLDGTKRAVADWI